MKCLMPQEINGKEKSKIIENEMILEIVIMNYLRIKTN